MSCVGQSPVKERRQIGPPRKLTAAEEAQIAEMYETTKVPVRRISELFQVCPKTVYNTLDRVRKAKAAEPPAA